MASKDQAPTVCRCSSESISVGNNLVQLCPCDWRHLKKFLSNKTISTSLFSRIQPTTTIVHCRRDNAGSRKVNAGSRRANFGSSQNQCWQSQSQDDTTKLFRIDACNSNRIPFSRDMEYPLTARWRQASDRGSINSLGAVSPKISHAQLGAIAIYSGHLCAKQYVPRGPIWLTGGGGRSIGVQCGPTLVDPCPADAARSHEPTAHGHGFTSVGPIVDSYIPSVIPVRRDRGPVIFSTGPNEDT